MSINDVYKKFNTPPNLQEHMLRVAKVAAFIGDNWKGPKIDKNKIVKMALVHDLGNVLRLDLDNHLEFLGSEAGRAEYWRKIQKSMIEKYGDEHNATKLMLEEISVDKDFIATILAKDFKNSVATVNGNNWPLKILAYSDYRVSPSGIVAMESRMNEAIKRRPDLNSNPELQMLLKATRRLEEHIQENITVPVSEINDVTIEKTSFARVHLANVIF